MNIKLTITGALSLMMILQSCDNNSKNGDMKHDKKKGITVAPWGETDGKKVSLFTLTNKNGMQATITNYGGIMTSWTVPDKNGNMGNILLGFDSLSGYLAKPPYFGALIGRYGNWIANGKFKIDTETYTLATNNGKNHLHGGNKGFDKVVWEASGTSDSIPELTLKYLSEDGEEGYPGNLHVTVKYTLTDDDELKIEYEAYTDKPTVINLTQHNYYNLTGDHSNTILDHTLMIDADHFTPVDSTLIPTGEIKAVKGTPFDFTTATKIGARIDSVPGSKPGGYDHNWVLNKKGDGMALVATLSEEKSGRKMEVYTTEPGLQFYSGNFLDGTINGSDGKPFNQHTGLCLETQHFPDSPNQPNFPSTLLKPGERYHTMTSYKISVNK
jgi:aldose 1-epimerase